MEPVRDFLPPTCYSSRNLESVSGIVLHHISAVNTQPEDPYNREALKDIFIQYGVSAHGLIERDGTLVQLMPWHKQAWHAGKSIMNGREGSNSFTRGYELVATPDDDFTDTQYTTLVRICRNTMQDFGFDFSWIQSHRKVRAEYRAKHGSESASRKYDPNSNFDWDRLQREARHGIPI